MEYRANPQLKQSQYRRRTTSTTSKEKLFSPTIPKQFHLKGIDEHTQHFE